MIVPHRKRDVLVLAAACVAVAVGARSFAAGQATTTLTLAVTGGTPLRPYSMPAVLFRTA